MYLIYTDESGGKPMICRCYINTETGDVYRVDNTRLPVKVYKYIPDLKEWAIIKGITAKNLRKLLGYE